MNLCPAWELRPGGGEPPPPGIPIVPDSKDRRVSTPQPQADGASLSAEEFGRLYEHAWKSLWIIAAAILSDRDHAGDVVQEAAITGLAKRHEFSRGTSFQHWMGQIVRYTALNELRKRQTRRERGGELTTDLAAAPPLSGPAGVGRFGELMDATEAFDDQTKRALRELDEVPRACLLLRTVLDLTYSEIAATLGIPEATAATHVHRSRQRMRTALGAAYSGVRA